MDDLALTEETPKAILRQQTLKEMARRSKDRILVYNPTADDYTCIFDSIGFVIPNRNKDNGHGLGRAVVFRYVAINYLTQMIDLLLTTKMDDAVILENERRAAKGEEPMTKYVGGQEPQFTQTLRTDNQEARRKLVSVVWLGLAERYGSETREESNLGKPKDDRPLDERLLDEIGSTAPVVPQNRVVEPTSTASSPPEDLINKDVFHYAKLHVKEGLKPRKQLLKIDLIKAISQ